MAHFIVHKELHAFTPRVFPTIFPTGGNIFGYSKFLLVSNELDVCKIGSQMARYAKIALRMDGKALCQCIMNNDVLK